MAGLATLLFDLLAFPEADQQRNIFDIALLAGRLVAATKWLRRQSTAAELAICYIGSSAGAAAALCAATELGPEISAIVLRGGRTDLAQSRLAQVASPTLMIVGGNDWEVLAHDRRARSMLRCVNDLAVVPGATHFFQEPGAHEQMTDLAIAWFTRHLSA